VPRFAFDQADHVAAMVPQTETTTVGRNTSINVFIEIFSEICVDNVHCALATPLPPHRAVASGSLDGGDDVVLVLLSQGQQGRDQGVAGGGGGTAGTRAGGGVGQN
jgi:hypothetical protein